MINLLAADTDELLQRVDALSNDMSPEGTSFWPLQPEQKRDPPSTDLENPFLNNSALLVFLAGSNFFEEQNGIYAKSSQTLPHLRNMSRFYCFLGPLQQFLKIHWLHDIPLQQFLYKCVDLGRIFCPFRANFSW